MIKNLFTAVVILIVIASGSSFGQKKIKEYKGPLLGKWETPNLGLDASHLTIEFKSGYKFFYDLKSQWNGKYKLDGTQLSASYFIPLLNKWVHYTSIALINADTLILAAGKDSAQSITKFVRLKDTSSTSNGIVGTWETNDFQDSKAIFTYHKDGKVSIQKTLNTYDGYFTVQKNIFSVFSNRAIIMKMKFQIIRGDLYLYKIGSPGVMKLVKGK
ncbi:MAG: hypothetical protein ACYCVH_01125 [Ignavibacteriaceae bacterium]